MIRARGGIRWTSRQRRPARPTSRQKRPARSSSRAARMAGCCAPPRVGGSACPGGNGSRALTGPAGKVFSPASSPRRSGPRSRRRCRRGILGGGPRATRSASCSSSSPRTWPRAFPSGRLPTPAGPYAASGGRGPRSCRPGASGPMSRLLSTYSQWGSSRMTSRRAIHGATACAATVRGAVASELPVGRAPTSRPAAGRSMAASRPMAVGRPMAMGRPKRRASHKCSRSRSRRCRPRASHG